MFSGIVEGLKKAKEIKKELMSMVVNLPIPKGWDLKVGESINIDGVCSTIQSISNQHFSVFYMPETLSRTILRNLTNDHRFNLERSLSLNSLVGGHLVSGHIDSTAKVFNIDNQGEAKVIIFKIDPKFSRYIIYKESIAVNGVSLTIVEITKNSFTVSLIPYTLSHTNLGDLKLGDKVNIEVDMMAKYLEKFLQPYLEKIK